MPEKLKLPVWSEVWGDVCAQRSMSFTYWLLDELFWWTGCCGPDGECSRVIKDLARFGGGDKAKAAFRDGEGAPRCTVVVVGQLGNMLELGNVGIWRIDDDIGSRRLGKDVCEAVCKARPIAYLDPT